MTSWHHVLLGLALNSSEQSELLLNFLSFGHGTPSPISLLLSPVLLMMLLQNAPLKAVKLFPDCFKENGVWRRVMAQFIEA